MSLIPWLLVGASVLALAAPVPAPSPTPNPSPSRYEWLLVPPEGVPVSSPEPVRLPDWLPLGTEEQGFYDQLGRASTTAESHLAARRLASARATIVMAESEAAAAETQHLVLRVHAGWKEARSRLAAARLRLAEERAKGIDAESLTLAKAASQRLADQYLALEKSLSGLKPPEARRRAALLKAARDQATADPWLVGNPAWPPLASALDQRAAKLQQRIEVLAGQALLLDQIIHMAELYHGAQAKLRKAAYEDALGDLAALEEACLGFKHDLATLVARGFDPQKIQFQGEEGHARSGQTFLGQVDRWLVAAQRREATVAEAKDPWRRVLTGDRLKLYGMRGVPSWPDAPPEPTVNEALAQPTWTYWELKIPKPGQRVRIKHVFTFEDDRLMGHDVEAPGAH